MIIESCRQQEHTLNQAETLAEKTYSFPYLVQIKIENRRDYMGAIKIIDQRIPDLKEKVQIL